MVDLLERNVAMNWFDDRVVVVRKAAGHLDEPLRFFAPREMRGLGSTAQPLEGRTSRPQSSEITVESERLDVGLAELGFIDLLKIDVEGGEADVLAGAASLLAERRVGMLALEYRLDAVDDLRRTEMEVRLRWLAEGLGVSFHLPSRPAPCASMRCWPRRSTRTFSSVSRGHPSAWHHRSGTDRRTGQRSPPAAPWVASDPVDGPRDHAADPSDGRAGLGRRLPSARPPGA
jgi:FkbM family methyltransferase